VEAVTVQYLAADALDAVAAGAGSDVRPPGRAVATLWSAIHGEVYKRDEAPYPALRVAFEALGAACGISDVTGYLGPALKRRTADERAACLRAAAASLRAQEVR
jgi:hypothetical protein